jgi:hypothetical protein
MLSLLKPTLVGYGVMGYAKDGYAILVVCRIKLYSCSAPQIMSFSF